MTATKEALIIGIGKDMKFNILTTSLIEVLSSSNFQNEYTTERQVRTLQFFTDMFKNVATGKI